MATPSSASGWIFEKEPMLFAQINMSQYEETHVSVWESKCLGMLVSIGRSAGDLNPHCEDCLNFCFDRIGQTWEKFICFSA